MILLWNEYVYHAKVLLGSLRIKPALAGNKFCNLPANRSPGGGIRPARAVCWHHSAQLDGAHHRRWPGSYLSSYPSCCWSSFTWSPAQPGPKEHSKELVFLMVTFIYAIIAIFNWILQNYPIFLTGFTRDKSSGVNAIGNADTSSIARGPTVTSDQICETKRVRRRWLKCCRNYGGREKCVRAGWNKC